MRGLRAAISQVPSTPGFILAALVLVGVGGWYYGSAFNRCGELRDSRAQLTSAIEAAAQGDTGVLNMASAAPGDWDEMRLAQGLKPAEAPYNCPFGWDLSAAERQALIDAGQYTIIGFFKDGQFQNYIEYRADWAFFDGVSETLPRADTVFKVFMPNQEGEPYIVRPFG